MEVELNLDLESMTTIGALTELIQRLRLYTPPSSALSDPENDDDDDDGDAVPRPVRAGYVRFRPRRAAVLICLFEGDRGELRVILTKRASTLSTHSGEVALPGGKAEEGDKDDADTATREAKEEIGLDPSLVTVVTVLEPFLSKHLLRVVPVVGILSDRQAFKPVVNAAEVEAIFDAPLEMFLKDENRRFEERERMGEKFMIHYFEFETGVRKFTIWGLTARILIHAASVVYQRPPAFPEQRPKYRVLRPLNEINCVLP